MKIWGKKIKCLHCNTKFYDFKQKDTKCPKCSKSQVVKSKTYKKTDTKKKVNDDNIARNTVNTNTNDNTRRTRVQFGAFNSEKNFEVLSIFINPI